MPSIDEILAVADDPAYHRVVTARIPMVPQALIDEHADLDAVLPTLVSDTIDAHPDRHATAVRLAEIEAEIEAAIVEFRFRSVGHRVWADLLRKHPPTQAQLRQDRKLDHDPETFPFEAIAVSCIDPVMTPEQVRRLESSAAIDVRAWTELWSACLRANVVAAAPKSLAAGLILRQSGGSATTRVNGASLDLSSLGAS